MGGPGSPPPIPACTGTRNSEPGTGRPTLDPVHRALGPRTSDLACLSDRRLSDLGTRNPEPRTDHPTPRGQDRNPELGTRNPEPGRHHRRDAGTRTFGIWPRPQAPSPEVGTRMHRMLHLARSHPARRAARARSHWFGRYAGSKGTPPPPQTRSRTSEVGSPDLHVLRQITNQLLSPLDPFGTRNSDLGSRNPDLS